MSSAEHIPYLVVWKTTKQLDSSMQIVLLNQSLKLIHSFTITANNKMYVFELSQDLWNNAYQKVYSFSVSKP